MVGRFRGLRGGDSWGIYFSSIACWDFYFLYFVVGIVWGERWSFCEFFFFYLGVTKDFFLAFVFDFVYFLLLG